MMQLRSHTTHSTSKAHRKRLIGLITRYAIPGYLPGARGPRVPGYPGYPGRQGEKIWRQANLRFLLSDAS
eukprot:2341918-Rhodomonas_salina.1